MQNATAETMMQPFMKLAQSNTELLTRFATSPEVTTQATKFAESLMQQMQEMATQLSHSSAFCTLAQGMMSNYMEFWRDLSESMTAGLTHGQSALMQQTEVAANRAIDMTQATVRRARQAV